MQRIPPAPGQESVWDYPRPPRVEPTSKHLRVVFNSVVIADTQRGQRVLETSHPPVYYFPPEDVQAQYLVPSARQTFCEWKGQGAYYHVKVGDRQADNAAWYYPKPTAAFAPIRNYIAFYAALMDECTVDGVVVIPQPGGFYGGWITPDIVGPFKGAPGTWGW
ncbi:MULTISPECIES: DUF427 domain-containing protein [unclassified Thermosynechococcus]|uniref:DUF427 domain-containing protein n=1 Tax=unclassified Thermosynechococcus TaxID=2622553 RepID=UPI0019F731FC|nr:MULTISPECIES: DUF427 domain-containing protein [unclassified Thermosynechococcus]HIK34273.1 DUF427 domain-containing protein [Thermosynechococcus sp. M98_K2018_005]HIK48898.1 DUF427 domain-containing protein [Thermosynechococcus sp. M55_K2018_012]